MPLARPCPVLWTRRDPRPRDLIARAHRAGEEAPGMGRNPVSPSHPPSTRPKRWPIRLPHRISTRKINILSPEIFRRTVKIPCATHPLPATLYLPHRIARHRTGATASGRLRAGRRDASPVRTIRKRSDKRRCEGSHDLNTGGERVGAAADRSSGRPWQQGLARASGCGKPGNGRGPIRKASGGSQDPCKDRVRAPGAFSDSPRPKRNGTRQRWGSRSRQKCNTRVRSTCARSIARIGDAINQISRGGAPRPPYFMRRTTSWGCQPIGRFPPPSWGRERVGGLAAARAPPGLRVAFVQNTRPRLPVLTTH